MTNIHTAGFRPEYRMLVQGSEPESFPLRRNQRHRPKLPEAIENQNILSWDIRQSTLFSHLKAKTIFEFCAKNEHIIVIGGGMKN